MTGSETGYNERSWAIDLIGHLKAVIRASNRSIQDAGGEQTIVSQGSALFPDVLLFGDRATARVLQGWELKMPDTDIADLEFRDDAERKACALGLDSFLLWNVTHARLYIRDAAMSTFVVHHEWSELADIRDRRSVLPNRSRWEGLARSIIGYLNDMFDSERLEGRQFIDAYRSGGVTALIMDNVSIVEQALKDTANRDSQLRSLVTLWWEKHQKEYSGSRMHLVLARAVIANWIGKILFAHILRETHASAVNIANLREDATPQDAMLAFRQISQECDFWTIFSDSMGLSSIPEKAWSDLKQFNQLLSDLRIGSIEQAQLGGILEATAEDARRKLRGQYPTPMALAGLLANLCIRDLVSDRILDPCCGSGTIPRAALELKLAAGILPEAAAATVFAGDLDPQAVQIATFALTKPSFIDIPLRVFQRDAFSLVPATTIEFQNPKDGTTFSEALGQFQAISCNLPFVAQAGRQHYKEAIRDVTELLECQGQSLSGKSDVAAYFPFVFHPLLSDGGRLGLIITNAWLGTSWGNSFYEALNRYYDLKSVITSGAGKWMDSSDVVTNILIMEKKPPSRRPASAVKFVVLRRPMEELDHDAQRLAAAQIELGQTHLDTMSIREVSAGNLQRFRAYGLGGNAQFVNTDWILDLPLTPLREHFEVSRGERRGKNALFYPTGSHGIEPEYIRPLAKSPADFTKLVGPATREAFACSRSEAELRHLGHAGALQWIASFKTPENMSKLARSGMMWYEMRVESLTEIVMSINYSDRLFVGRLNPPAFVDQRLVRLMPKGEVDIGLCHALLNSSVGLFIIEGLGFGRGLGALDLNKDQIGAYMHFLDPRILCPEKSECIKNAFLPLLDRELLGVADELDQGDRQHFDAVVIDSYGLSLPQETIYESLRSLVDIRSTAAY